MDMESNSPSEFAEQIEYIRNLEMPVWTPQIAARFAGFSSDPVKADGLAGKEVGAVVGDSVVAYDAQLSEQNREDIDDSVLLAQIQATKAFNPETHRKEWYAKYTEVLTMCGWATTNDAYQEYKPSEQSFTMDEAALQIIAAIAGPNKVLVLSLASAAFNALKKNEDALNLFENKSKTNNAGNFQVLPCIRLPDGRLTMVLNCMQFTSRQRVTRVLFFKFSSADVTVYRAAAMRSLNQRAYNAVRATVQEQVDKFRLEFIKSLF